MVGHNGYTYRKDSSNITSVNWRCSVRGCKGRLSTPVNYSGPDITPVEKGTHNHAPNPAKVGASAAVSRLKRAAVESHVPPRRIISGTVVALNDEEIVNLPSRSNLRRTIQRKRTRDEAFPRLPQEVNFAIPDQYRSVTINNRPERFLLGDTFDEDEAEEDQLEDRVICFATDEMLNLLESSSHWMADGTFKISPDLFFAAIHHPCNFWK